MAKEKFVDPEDSYRKKLDMCITDAIIKGGGGILLGTVASILIIKRKWPIATGLGIGMGFSFANCHFEMNIEDKTRGSIHTGTPIAAFTLWHKLTTT